MRSGFGRQFEVILHDQDAGDGPIGPIFDIIRAFPDPDYRSPMDQMGRAAWEGFKRIPGAIAQVGQKVTDFLQFIGEKTPIDEAGARIFNEIYLAWSGPEQIRQGRTGLLAQGLGAPAQLAGAPQTQPGDIAINRGLAFGTGLLGGMFNFGQDIGSPTELWERTRHLTAGQTAIEEALGMPEWRESDRLTARSSVAYNMTSGTIDAGLGWFLGPDVLVGKTLKLARQAITASDLSTYLPAYLASKSRALGMDLAPMADEGIEGALNLQITDSHGQQLYHVTRRSSYQRMSMQGIVSAPKGTDEALEASGELSNLTREMQSRDMFPEGRELDEAFEIYKKGPEGPEGFVDEVVDQGGVDLSEFEAEFINQEAVRDQAAGEIMGQLDGMIEDPVSRIDPDDLQLLEQIQDGQAFTAEHLDLYMKYLNQAAEFGEMPREFRHLIARAFWKMSRQRAYLRHNNVRRDYQAATQQIQAELGHEGFLDLARGDEQAVGEMVREQAVAGPGLGLVGAQSGKMPNPEDAIYMLGEGDLPEAMRYAAALYKQNPVDPPVIITIKPDGLPVFFEDFLDPLRIDPRSGLTSSASLITKAKHIRPENVMGIQYPNELELEGAINFATQSAAFDPLVPGGRIHDKLFLGDRTPVEPGDIFRFDEVEAPIRAAQALYDENPEAASRFLRAWQIKRDAAQGSTGVARADVWASNRKVTKVLNSMDGMSADDIRRLYFPNHVYGAIISDVLSSTKTYADRRAALLAFMGIKTPDIELMAPIARARVEMLTEELHRGFPGGQVGITNRYHRDLELGMMTGHEVDVNQRTFFEAQQMYADEIADLTTQARIGDTLQLMYHLSPISEMPRVPVGRRLWNEVRTTHWYQDSFLSRPIRSVVEKRPRQFVYLSDPMGDIQIRRQLEEAAPLGITSEQAALFSNRFMGARDFSERLIIVEEMESTIMEQARRISGLSKGDWEKVLSAQRTGRRMVGEILKSRRYDGKGRDVVQWIDTDTGEVMEMIVPLLGSQITQWVPLTDVRSLISATTWARRLMHDVTVAPEALMESFYHIWKPSVLLRGGWPIRVVGDEQLRMLAKTSSLLQMLAAITTGETLPIKGMMAGASTGTKAGRAAFSPALFTTSAIQRTAKSLGGAAERLGILDPQMMKLMREAGTEPLASSRASFEGPNESVMQYFESVLGRFHAGALDHMATRGAGQFMSVGKESRLYGPAWMRVLKEDIATDDWARYIVQEAKNQIDTGVYDEVALIDRATDWLKANAEYQARMPWRTDPDLIPNPDLRKWAEDSVGMVRDYTAGFHKSLTNGVLTDKVRVELLEGIDERLRPSTVHAEMLAQTFGRGPVVEFMRDFFASGYDFLGRLPTDTLSRQPFFRWNYATEMKRMVAVATREGRDFTEAVVKGMDRAARDFSLNQVKTYLYDLAETSRFGDMMRFFFPFYPAWQEVIQVWSGLASKDPSIIARAFQLWHAPNKAGMITTDEEGNEFITFVMSERMADKMGLTGWSRYLATGGVRFGKTSFNIALNNPLPGFGPVVQIPFNEIAIHNPELEEMLGFILPLGVRSGSTFASRAWRMAASPILQRAESYLSGLDQDTTYRRYFVDALSWLDYRYRAGISTEPPTLSQAHEIARKIMAIRVWANVTSPAQPIFDSPLKAYVDAYRDLIEFYGPEDADERFIAIYGEELAAVTISRTVSRTGIPSTVEAHVARQRFENLIEQYPEYGRMIIGEDASVGEFSMAAFAWQLSHKVNPDDPFSEMEREYRTIELTDEGSIKEVDTRLGWQEYTKALDLIEAERRARGLPNLRVAFAQDLADAKRAITERLKELYPGWWEEFNLRDELKWQKRIEALRSISNSPLITEDPTRQDMAGVRDYLEGRSLILQELNRRKQLGGSSTLDSMANQDLYFVWQSIISKLLDDNVAFSPLYYRYLEGDPVSLR